MSLWNTHSTESEHFISTSEHRRSIAPGPDAPIRPAPAPVDRQAIEDWLVAEIAQAQGIDVDQVDVHESFIANGLNSAASVALVGDLASLLGVTLSETLAWEYPSIVALAEHVAGVRQGRHDA